MADKDILGRAGEDRAARYLEGLGFEILDRNWRSPDGGELDLVVAAAGVVVFVEVKTRRSARFGDPLAAVDAVKRRRLWRLANDWRTRHPGATIGSQPRIDVIGLTGADVDTAILDHVVDVGIA